MLKLIVNLVYTDALQHLNSLKHTVSNGNKSIGIGKNKFPYLNLFILNSTDYVNVMC